MELAQVLFWTVAAIISIVVIFLWWMLPIYQVKKLRERNTNSYQGSITDEKMEEFEDIYRKTITTALTGALILTSAGVAYFQWLDTSSSTRTQIADAREKVVSDNDSAQLAKAADLLGRNTASERLIGVHLLNIWLKHVKLYSDTRRDIVIGSLMGLIRAQTTDKDGIPDERCSVYRNTKRFAKPADIDVRAAIDVLVELSQTKDISLNFRGVQMSQAEFTNGKFSSSRFEFSNLAESNFEKATLTNSNFYCADLYKARMASAILSSTDHKHSQLGTTNLLSAIMIGVDATGADFSNADAREVWFNGATLNKAKLHGTALNESNFDSAQLKSVEVDSKTQLFRSCFFDTDFDNSITVVKDWNTVFQFAHGVGAPPDHVCSKRYKSN